MVSGAGRKVFQPGEVLTASNVQNYLQDQAVMVFAGTAARGSAIGTATTEGMMSYLADTNSVQMATGTATWVNVDGVPIVAGTAARNALYPSPVPGNIVFRSDSLQRETYYAAAGTPTRSAGWYSGQDGGLVPIIPASVTVGSGSASISENGLITFSSVSYILLNNVFSSNFRNYRVDFAMAPSSQTDILFKMANGSTLTTNSIYSRGPIVADNSQSYLNGFNNLAYGYITTGNSAATEKVYSSADIGQPFLSNVTTLCVRATGYNGATYTTNNTNSMVGTLTSYEGIYFWPGSGTISGTMQFYGYRN